MSHMWDFEKPIVELENKVEGLRKFSTDKGLDLSVEIANLDTKLKNLKGNVYANLSPWQRVQISRHPQRPTTKDYIELMLKDFISLAGDRLFGDDKALIAGFAKIDDHKVAVIGHQKGKDTKENIMRNFGCAHPEGYRKAMRVMRLAQRFGMPIICLVDTPGAYPGIGAEERGQAQAIAENIRDMFGLKTPVIVTVIGEGGSGGALGIGIGDRVFMMEYAYYSVISPEGCSAILWKDASKRDQAANVLKLTGPDLMKLGVVDGVIGEPQGGAHHNYQAAAASLKSILVKALAELVKMPIDELLEKRFAKYRSIGEYHE